MKHLFTKHKARTWLLALVLWAGMGAAQAQTDAQYWGGPAFVGPTDTLRWYGNVILGSDLELTILDGGVIYFYGDTLTMQPGAKIYGSSSATYTPATLGLGTGKIVFQKPNPQDGSTNQQVLDGGNSGNPANNTQNTFTSIEIDNTNGVKLVNTDSRVGTNILFTKGHLYLDTHDMVLSSAGTLSNYDQNRYVVTAASGHLVKEGLNSIFIFPVGMADGDYTPASIKSSAPETYHVNVTNYATSASVEAGVNGINRSWNIYANAGTVAATVDLQHNTTTNQAQFDNNNCFVTRWGATTPNATGETLSSLTAWQSNTQAAGSATGTLTTGAAIAGASERIRPTAYSSFATTVSDETSWFTKSSNPVYPLPLELLSFTGQQKEENVVLNWKVEKQVNTDRFEIEYSVNGMGWQKIGSQKAAGTHEDMLQYTYVHGSPQPGSNYYRLKMVDLDGHYTYSNNVVLVNFAAPTACLRLAKAVYPVPFTDRLSVGLYSCKDQEAIIQLWDVLGKKYREEKQQLNSGTREYHLTNLSGLPAGSYILRIQTNSGVLVQKVVK